MKYIKFFSYSVYGFFLATLIGAFIAGALVQIFHTQWIDFSVLERYDPGVPTRLLDENGAEWARFQLEKREPVELEQMPPHLIQAFIATEDWCFFSHHGISWSGIARSLLVNVYSGRIVQGASTITQQLVKLLFFNAKKTFGRKVREQVCALLVEQQFTKQQILQTYLNHIYFGCGIYGVEAACQRFWGKSVRDVTIDEAAVLAGIVRSPAQYCPLLCPLSSKKRQVIVLGNMRRLGFIDKTAYECLIDRPIETCTPESKQIAPHLKESIRLFLQELVGADSLYTGGYVVKTTLNKSLQEHAEQAFYHRVQQLKNDLQPSIDGALISLDVTTGAVRALVGGYDFNQSKFNRALQARRQIGSVFKPLIYASAVQQGYSFTETEVDEPLDVVMPSGDTWSPQNFNRTFEGRVTLAYALYRSSNIIAIKMLDQVGYDPVIALAQKCGISGPFNRYPSLALGCVDGTLSDIAGMFNIFANNGVHVEPHYISWVKDRWGTKIYRSSVRRTNVVTPYVAGSVNKVLTLALKRVRQWFHQKKWLDCQAISKTGTTNDCRTCWYAGSTPAYTTAVYIGTDDNQSMGKNIYPLRTAFPIWMSYMMACEHKPKSFCYDRALQEVLIHERSGRRLRAERDPQAICIFE